MNVTDAIFDSELGCTSFIVQRITYTRSRSGTSSSTSETSALGSIHPGTPEMVQLLPEEERNKQFISVYTDYPLSEGTAEASASNVFTGQDRIVWNDKTWRVVRVRDWSYFGYYQAYAVEMKEGT